MPLGVFAIITARPGAEAELRNGLYNLVVKVREEDACLLYELFESAEHPEKFIMHELWTDEAGLQAHDQMPHMKAFGEKATNWLAGPVELIKVEK
ncbi:antibiotic biosynthesis monooxygenase [Spirosoma aureum]|uniref:Antibiotic biosynthesis monooxygenase n=1 Tax=Spirosoma aureum TaxID=2692134 RepID=A0A6G9AP97_9BACT|nr:putative quinol monooxygenase [Spirosoma aureum]QIP14033.1 antibiotic biosynthesis monooxygenase [Spirosoma aureum]